MNVFKKGALSQDDIIDWLKSLRIHAYVPESGFAVSAVFRVSLNGTDDYYFAGVNVENIDHRISTCGEEGCIAAMVTSLGKQAEIVEGWVMGAPQKLNTSDGLASCCGKCRQQIAGFAGENVKMHAISLNNQVSTTTVGKFLPDLFTFRQYIPDLKKPKNSGTAAPRPEDIQNKLIRQAPQSEQDILAWLRGIESVDYVSKTSQSIVIRLDNGYYVAGTKVEEAAFSSTNAAQSALAIAITAFGIRTIQEAWVYTKSLDDRNPPAEGFGALAMSALQNLLQCAEHNQIPIRFFAEDGRITTIPLSEAARIAPTSRQPFYKKT